MAESKTFKQKAREKALEGRPPPLDEPRTKCPFTGEDISIVKAGDKWMAFTSLWTSRPYDFKDSLVYGLSHNGGTAPNMPRPGVQVIRDANEPPGSKEYVGPTQI